MDADRLPPRVTELRARVQEQRTILEQLETQLAEEASNPPPELVRGAFTHRSARIARNEVRRAARRVKADSNKVVPVAWPAGERWEHRDAAEIAGARSYTWRRTDEVAEALAKGDSEWVTGGLNDLLATEQAIQVLVDDIPLPPHWRSLGNDLSEASDMIIDALREQLAGIERPPIMARVRTGQSAWVRAWRPFLLVIGHEHR